MLIADLIQKLTSVKSTGPNKWQCQCPAHEDRKSSLTVSGSQDGTILIHCHAGCGTDEICSAVGITVSDLFPAAKKTFTKKSYQSDPIIYNYHDPDNKLIMQAIRRPDKSFTQRKPDGAGGWVYKLGKLKRYLYHLPEIIQADPSRPVFIPEGEKDVDNLRKLGFLATCNVGGAGKWRDDYSEYLRDRKCIILPDNDKPGRKHADQIAASLARYTDKIKVLILPDLHAKGDVSDWLSAGGDRVKLLQLAADCLRYQLPAQRLAQGENASRQKPDRVAIGYKLTDAGNAERFAVQHRNTLRYCYTHAKWLVFNGKFWDAEKGEAAARRLAVQTARSIDAEANQARSLTVKEQMKRWAIESERSSRITATLTEARGLLESYADEYDADPWLLNCNNGIINLKTGTLQPHDPNLLLTKLAPADYQPDATLPMWDNFLLDSVDDNGQVLTFLQRAAGYSLTGLTTEETLFFIHGPAAAGKSTFMEALKSTLGDYAATSDFDTFLAKSSDNGIRNDIARLKASRLVASIEVDDGKRLAEGLVKAITGGDKITARYLYREAFEFKPQFKLWLCANHEPKVRGDDDAIWRRILRIPFARPVPKEKRDPAIKQTLTNPQRAGPAILNWMVAGCQCWQQIGLAVPEEITTATEEYREKMDPLKDWIDERCELYEAALTSVKDLRADYDSWAKDNGVRFTVGRNVFNQRLRTLGINYITSRYNGIIQKCWQGVQLRNDSLLDY